MRKPLLLLLSATGMVAAESVFTNPLGWNNVTCLNDSDTIVGVPLRIQGSQTTFSLASAPTIDAGSATLTLSSGNLTPSGLTRHYVKFKSGTKSGSFYDITANDATTITINLNGDVLTGATTGDSVGIVEYWTLDTLFPPAEATTDWTETPEGSGNWVQNGNAIVASTNIFPTGRFTEILLPRTGTEGINLAPEGRYFVYNGQWHRSTSGFEDFGSTILYPDTLLTIRNPPTVAHPTVFKNLGDVETGPLVIPLGTREAGPQDNYIAVPRPLDVTLEELNLRQSPGAFMPSTDLFPGGRRDEVLVFKNEDQLLNKAPEARYFVLNGVWLRSTKGFVDYGSAVIPAGSGIIIRKYQVAGGVTSFWKNTPTY